MTTRAGNVVIGIYNKAFRRSFLSAPLDTLGREYFFENPTGRWDNLKHARLLSRQSGRLGILSEDSVSKTITPPPFQPLFSHITSESAWTAWTQIRNRTPSCGYLVQGCPGTGVFRPRVLCRWGHQLLPCCDGEGAAAAALVVDVLRWCVWIDSHGGLLRSRACA